MGVILCMRASVGCIHAHVLKLSSSIQCAVYRWDAVNLHLSPVNFSPPLLARPRHIAHVRAALRTASHIRRQRSDSMTSPECDRRIRRKTRSARQREWCKLTNYELRERRSRVENVRWMTGTGQRCQRRCAWCSLTERDAFPWVRAWTHWEAFSLPEQTGDRSVSSHRDFCLFDPFLSLGPAARFV